MRTTATLLLGLAALALLPWPLLAFDCLETDEASNPLPGTAPIIRWADSDILSGIRWAIVRGSTPDPSIDEAAFLAAAQAAFDAWQAVSTSRIAFTPLAVADGATETGVIVLTNPQHPDSYFAPGTPDLPVFYPHAAGLPTDDGYCNSIVAITDPDMQAVWMADNGLTSLTLGVTLFTWDVATQRMLGGDIALFAAPLSPTEPGNTWSISGSGGWDVQGVLTHEIGHLIALAHSQDSSAVMYWSVAGYSASVSLRTLKTDDINGATYLYPEEGATIVPPDHLYTAPAPVDGGGGGGCSVAPSGSSLGWAAAFAPLLGLSLVLAGRRKRRLAWATAAVMFLSLAGTARATLVLRLNVMELTLMSSKVAQVTVYDVTPYMDGGRIMRRVRAVVHDPVKGSRDAELEFVLPGGIVNGRGMGIAGTPSFEPGEEAVVFLEGAKGHIVTGMSQGKFGVVRDASGATAVQDTRGLCLLDARPPAPGEAGAPATSWAAPLAAPGAAFLKAGDSTAPSLPGHGGHVHGGILKVPLPELLDTIRSFTGQ